MPIELPDDEYIAQWQAYEYEKKPFRDNDTEFYTDLGERVRSKSEIIIANTLLKMKIPYRYECPLRLQNGVWIYPDFTVLRMRDRRELYLEHLGMMDDLTYCESAMRRITQYEMNGLYPGDRLLLTHETRREPLNLKLLERILEFYIL